MTAEIDIPKPQARSDFLGPPGFEAGLAQCVNAGAMTNGWLITGGEGIGKATLAYRLARALLWRERPADAAGLDVPRASRVFSLVASGGHPDLFVAERKYDEKKERYASEIVVETIRELTSFLSHTASMGGWRVAIVDTADDLNRNAANALLKVLEEPPPKAAILLLSASPGRLPATIRSRCRRIEMRPLAAETVCEFLVREGVAKSDHAEALARESGGRPGFAFRLALIDGAEAISAADAFWSALVRGADAGALTAKLAAKSADGLWRQFQTIFIDRLTREARERAAAQDGAAAEFVAIRERIIRHFARGDALNLDRAQIMMAVEREFRTIPRNATR